MEIPLIEKGKQCLKKLKKRLESPKSIGDRDLLDFIKALPLFFCIALIWFLFEAEFIRLFNKHILPLSLKMSFSFITHCLFCIIVILILLHCIYNKCYKNRYFVPWNIILPSSFGIGIYIEYRIKYYVHSISNNSSYQRMLCITKHSQITGENRNKRIQKTCSAYNFKICFSRLKQSRGYTYYFKYSTGTKRKNDRHQDSCRCIK